ncbi:unnamed protein product [Leptosia nina]|uniref:Protein arginine N-methyltransferase domain-containing protein n=1 Tax=Leptosia nina TaxID=320188 RepID=A0AAV1JJ96_9NEOP
MSDIVFASAREYIKYARKLAMSESYSKAFDMYIAAFEKNPDLKEYHGPELRAVMSKLNDILVCTSRIDDIFSNFSRAISIFPGDMYLLNDVGKYLYKFGYYAEAFIQFQKALKVDPGYVNAEKNLNSVKNILLDRWHYRMLNDVIRNTTYRAALHETVRPGDDTVLDVGSGTGLLSLYAQECNPKSIAACDSSEVMANISNTVLHSHSVKEFKVVNQNSGSILSPDIGGKCSILVTELFDAGLFGEHILTTLSYAWKNLLCENARVLPQSAEFFVVGVNCKELLSKYQLCHNAKELLKIMQYNIHAHMEEESYDCEDINSFETLKFITEDTAVVKVDFCDSNHIEDKLHNTEPYITHLTVTQDGELTNFIGWFNLNLSSTCRLTTNPRCCTKANAWQQAVFFDTISRPVKEGEKLVCKFSLQSGKISLLSDSNMDIIRVSTDMLRFLNDMEYVKKIMDCLGLACVYLGQLAEMSDITIVDMCPFPIFGLQMLKRGIKSIVCCPKMEMDKTFMHTVFLANNIDSSKITYLMEEDWSKENFGDEKYHAIFCNILELAGDIAIHYKEMGLNLKQTSLHSGGLFLPTKTSIIAQIAKCNYLDTNNRLDDKNVSNYKIARHLNKYQASQNFFIDLSRLEYTPLSEPVNLGECMEMLPEVINVPITKTDDANCILCWYEIELMENMAEISTKRPCSFIDATIFLADPHIFMKQGRTANILHCVDSDGSFKLMLDVEAM